jgi:hypothetical protein
MSVRIYKASHGRLVMFLGPSSQSKNVPQHGRHARLKELVGIHRIDIGLFEIAENGFKECHGFTQTLHFAVNWHDNGRHGQKGAGRKGDDLPAQRKNLVDNRLTHVHELEGGWGQLGAQRLPRRLDHGDGRLPPLQDGVDQGFFDVLLVGLVVVILLGCLAAEGEKR